MPFFDLRFLVSGGGGGGGGGGSFSLLAAAIFLLVDGESCEGDTCDGDNEELALECICKNACSLRLSAWAESGGGDWLLVA